MMNLRVMLVSTTTIIKWNSAIAEAIANSTDQEFRNFLATMLI